MSSKTKGAILIYIAIYSHNQSYIYIYIYIYIAIYVAFYKYIDTFCFLHIQICKVFLKENTIRNISGLMSLVNLPRFTIYFKNNTAIQNFTKDIRPDVFS